MLQSNPKLEELGRRPLTAGQAAPMASSFPAPES